MHATHAFISPAGAANMLVYVVLAEVLGVENIARASGLSFAAQGLAALTAQPFAGEHQLNSMLSVLL